MDVCELPVRFLQHETFHFIVPTMERAEEMQMVLNRFNALHHEFLLWSPGKHALEDVRKNMDIAIQNFHQDRDEYKFLIIGNDDERLLGCISLFIRNAKVPYYEIGYWLATNAMGRGVMTSACQMARNIAREFFNAKRIEIRTAKRNIRSQAVALKCGFRHEATLTNERVDGFGRIDDTYIYSYIF